MDKDLVFAKCNADDPKFVPGGLVDYVKPRHTFSTRWNFLRGAEFSFVFLH